MLAVTFRLAGCPIHQNNWKAEHVTMNALNCRADNWWATYLKAAGFLVPPLLLWVLAVVFIVPKLEQICADAGGRPLPAFLQAMLMLTDHGVLFLVLICAGFALLECFSEGWVRYRKVVTGFAVFLLNSVILSSFFVMLITFAMVAPALIQVGR
jgi:hypothetical protein